MKSIAKVLQNVKNMNGLQKIAFIDNAIQKGCCPIMFAEMMDSYDTNNLNGRWLIKTETEAERTKRKLSAKDKYFAEMMMHRNMHISMCQGLLDS